MKCDSKPFQQTIWNSLGKYLGALKDVPEGLWQFEPAADAERVAPANRTPSCVNLPEGASNAPSPMWPGCTQKLNKELEVEYQSSKKSNSKTVRKIARVLLVAVAAMMFSGLASAQSK